MYWAQYFIVYVCTVTSSIFLRSYNDTSVTQQFGVAEMGAGCIKMSSETSWKNGLWVLKSEGLHEVYEVDGREVIKKSLAYLDVPDVPKEHFANGTWSSGDFGTTPDRLKVHTSDSNFNFWIIIH